MPILLGIYIRLDCAYSSWYAYGQTWIICFRFPQLQFQYRDPEKNFDRRRVNGLVAKLIKVNDVSTATALEVAAGGKVYFLYFPFLKTKQLLIT